MNFVQSVFNSLTNHFSVREITTSTIFAVLFVVTLLAVYEFVVYHIILHRSLYNKSFNICVAILPYFISTIILTLQSNLVVTLGTIGALAIIRFRTAIKDPVDMVFLLWAVHTGITCGCQLYELAIITSVVVTIVLVILNKVSFGSRSHILIVHAADLSGQAELEAVVKDNSTKYRFKSRNITDKGVNYVIEVNTKNAAGLSDAVSGLDGIERFSLMEYDPDDVV